MPTKQHSLRQGRIEVSLTTDAYDYNDLLFTLEVTEMNGDEGVENDADVSGLDVKASQPEIDAFLVAALQCAVELAGPQVSVRNVAGKAATKGLEATVKAGASTLANSDVVEKIAEVLRGAGGSWVAKIYNQVCEDRVEYVGDGFFKRVAAEAGV